VWVRFTFAGEHIFSRFFLAGGMNGRAAPERRMFPGLLV
jgi:hypothetical protein